MCWERPNRQWPQATDRRSAPGSLKLGCRLSAGAADTERPPVWTTIVAIKQPNLRPISCQPLKLVEIRWIDSDRCDERMCPWRNDLVVAHKYSPMPRRGDIYPRSAAETVQIAREINRHDMRELLSFAISNLHSRFYRMLERLGPTAQNMTTYQRLNEDLGGPAVICSCRPLKSRTAISIWRARSPPTPFCWRRGRLSGGRLPTYNTCNTPIFTPYTRRKRRSSTCRCRPVFGSLFHEQLTQV
jgi:hypothetical protein